MSAHGQDISEALEAFAAAATKLCDLWTGDQYDSDGNSTLTDDVLTRTYPACIAMSFDEYVAELWAWHEAVTEAFDGS